MKVMLKGKYGTDKSAAASASATLSAAPAGDLRLKASVTDATFLRCASLDGLSFSLEKPGSLILDFNVPKRDVTFQFMNSVCLAEKLVSLTYRHAWRENRTALDCSVEFDPANKLAVNYALPTGCKVKYVYAHGEMPRRTVLEPSYDLSKNAWDFAVSRKFDGGDSLKATYLTSTKILGVEWSRDSKINGSFKILQTVGGQKILRMMRERML
ncbi:outer envelope pore protein 24, chloroplastic-like isoform X2 [Ananas comosus]|uniref:Outer envelope pore protein 24, chloroplastic-like isoform X2 n=1 Tax=Ananas comosus TaxID=4615 RepID=A0A6P5FBE7_ANACO|nr:outer envelope pore protein 24, chloroplastic-like isoform X2 [Ananas comosus]XP_020092918.1 outer envelope pore protein 24, chloroplastic-like isoform X2 [Ananas comosus]